MGSKWFTGGVVAAEDMNKPGGCADDSAVHDSVRGEALYCAHPTRTRADMSGKTSTFEWGVSVGRSSSFNALKHLLQIMLGAFRVSVVISVGGGRPYGIASELLAASSQRHLAVTPLLLR